MNTGCDNKMTCPITHTLNLISAKWTVEILRELALKPVCTREFLTFNRQGLTLANSSDNT